MCPGLQQHTGPVAIEFQNLYQTTFMVLNFAIVTVVTVNLLFLERLLLGAAGLQNHSPLIKAYLGVRTLLPTTWWPANIHCFT